MDINRITNLITEDPDVLAEDLESRIPHLINALTAGKTKFKGNAEKYIRMASQFDPSGNKGSFMPFITKQAKIGAISLPNDGERLLRALEFYQQNSRKKDWPGEKDINQYANWRVLEKQVNEIEGKGGIDTTSEKERRWKKEGAELILELNINTTKGVINYKAYGITNPYAAVLLGMGTSWCTTSLSDRTPDIALHNPAQYDPRWNDYPEETQQRMMDQYDEAMKYQKRIKNLEKMKVGRHEGYPLTAVRYLNNGPLYIIMRDNKPYIQAKHNFMEFMNDEDLSIKKFGPPTDFFLGHLAEVIDPFVKDTINDLRQSVGQDYKGRPPTELNY